MKAAKPIFFAPNRADSTRTPSNVTYSPTSSHIRPKRMSETQLLQKW